MASVDPRTPVVVGVGQVTDREDPERPDRLVDRPEPVALMEAALRAAVEDCDGSRPGATSPAGAALVARAGSVVAVPPSSWEYPNPAGLVAERLGLDPAELALVTTGGSGPQRALDRAALAIGRGAVDVVVLVGGDCGATAARARTDPERPVLPWTARPPGGLPPTVVGTQRRRTTAAEATGGLDETVRAFPFFENALRARSAASIADHRHMMGTLWSRFAAVAAANPSAWTGEPLTAEEITTVTDANPAMSFPYVRLLTANRLVDQGAALILCSAGVARSAGVPVERWVFPQVGAEAHDHWFLSHRIDFTSSPALRLAASATLAHAATDVDELAHLDLYSAAPASVEVTASELGVALDDRRGLTLTGGLTFFGAPGSSYGLCAIVAMVRALRAGPEARGLVTSLDWTMTEHAIGLYGTGPAERPSDVALDASRCAVEEAAGFRRLDPQAAVDAEPQCPPDADAFGAVTVETYTVTYDPDGRPARGIVACRTTEGRRTWGVVSEPDQLDGLLTEEGCGRRGRLRPDGRLDLR